MTGNINSIIDINGKVMVKYYYDAYGNPTIQCLDEENDDYFVSYALSKCNVFMYKGYIYDVETNLALVSSRYYSPELGRFIQPADVSSLNPQSINGLNLYAYANNNPIGLAYSSSVVGFGDSGAMVSLLSLGGLSSFGNNLVYSNSLNIFAGLSMPQLFSKKSLCDLAKDFSVNIGEVLGRVIWGLTKNGHAFSDFHYAADGINGYTLFDNLPSTSGKIFKGLGIALMINDVFEAGYNSYQNGHSFGQGALNVGLTAGKNYLIYKASIGITTSVGTWAGAKLRSSLGSFAGPVGMVIGAIAGTAVGWLIDEFGDAIIDWVVGWFD